MFKVSFSFVVRLLGRVSNGLLISKPFVSDVRMHLMKKFGILLAMMAFWSGCSTAQKKNAEQQIVPVDREASLAERLEKELDRAYGEWKDPAVEKLLHKILKKLAASSETNGADAAFVSDVRIHLLKTKVPYAAPGFNKTIILSRGIFDFLRYENELAFLLGSELYLLRDRASARNLANLQGQQISENLITLPTNPQAIAGGRDHLAGEWFEPGGLFDFGSEAYLKAEAAAIKQAYGAKYDPRGAVTLIERWTLPSSADLLKALGKILPEPEERLSLAREEVAKLSPLRDPIVKGQAFEELQTLLKKAKTKNANRAKI
jgi:predicted Zn-dependent protease